MKPALLVTQPLHLDFPVFRWNMERFKDYFSNIYIAFSNHHVPDQDLSNFIRAKLPFCIFVDVERTRDDWRDDAVNCALDKAKDEEYVLFFEQDFLIYDHTFFDKIFSNEHDFIYFQEDTRIHPAFACVKMDLVQKTHRDFSAHPPGDHFYRFFNEILELDPGVNIDDLGVKKREDYYHMNGLSQNYQCFKYEDPFYHPINFLYYNALSLRFKDQHPLFLSIQQQIENKYGHTEHHTFLDRFFPE